MSKPLSAFLSSLLNPSLTVDGFHQNMNNIAGSSFPGSVAGSVDFLAGLLKAKNRILIAMAKPACRQTTKMSSALLVCLSVALRTGYKFLKRKATLTPKPTPTKT